MMPSGSEKILALHGFLGLAKDWDSIDLPIEGYDLWRDLEKVNGFESWAAHFNEIVAKRKTKPVLLGYSMGGRLAMQAVLKRPELYRALIVVASNPGLTEEEDRQRRLALDQKWAERFRNEEWSSLIEAWTAQPVLRAPRQKSLDAVSLSRVETEFDREALARGLDLWSLARQPDFREGLSQLRVPALFISGSEDTKFTEIMRGLRLTSSQKLLVIEGAGHRVPWDRPQAFAQAVRDFLAGVPEVC